MAKAHTFTDNFNDNTINTSLWTAYNDVKEVNQRLELRPVPTSSTLNYVGYQSVNTYDMTGSSTTIEVVQVLPSPAGTETYLSVEGTGKPISAHPTYAAAVAGFGDHHPPAPSLRGPDASPAAAPAVPGPRLRRPPLP